VILHHPESRLVLSFCLLPSCIGISIARQGHDHRGSLVGPQRFQKGGSALDRAGVITGAGPARLAFLLNRDGLLLRGANRMGICIMR